MDEKSLSFAELERRIEAMPDGPASVLSTPRWILWFNAVGTLGLCLGLLPSWLVRMLEPQMWMVHMARVGLGFALAGYAPGFVRSVWVILLEFLRWRPKLAEQSDHDLARFRELRCWLRTFPCQELKDHLSFARLSNQRLSSKLGLLAGGLDKLGILPALLALLVLLKNAGDLSLGRLAEIQMWQVVLGLMFGIAYFIGLLALNMRLRLQFYDVVLADAVEQKNDGTGSGSPTKVASH